MGNEEPVSIPTMLKRNANEVPNEAAMKAKDPETGKEVSCVFIWYKVEYQISDINRTKRYPVIKQDPAGLDSGIYQDLPNFTL